MCKCDFCGKKVKDKDIIRTSYGTSHYTRLICKECNEEIKKGEGN